MSDSIRPEFQVHILNASGLGKASALQDIFTDALNKIEALVPPTRERSLVVTKLQEACFFAKRAIAILPENQETR
jgi:hypothetical protein